MFATPHRHTLTISGRDPRLRGYNHLTASGQDQREDSIAIHSDLRTRLEEQVSLLDSQGPAGGIRSRVIEALLSPFRRARIDPVVETQRAMIDILRDANDSMGNLDRMVAQLEDARSIAAEHLESLEAAKARATDDIATLQGNAEKIRDHLGQLQNDHTRLGETVAELVEGAESHGDALKRVDLLWADLQRDMTALAEALSSRDDG